jgi:hypothetical protein
MVSPYILAIFIRQLKSTAYRGKKWIMPAFDDLLPVQSKPIQPLDHPANRIDKRYAFIGNDTSHVLTSIAR